MVAYLAVVLMVAAAAAAFLEAILVAVVAVAAAAAAAAVAGLGVSAASAFAVVSYAFENQVPSISPAASFSSVHASTSCTVLCPCFHCENSSRTAAYCGSHLTSLSRLRKLVTSVTPFAPPSSSINWRAEVTSASLSAAGAFVMISSIFSTAFGYASLPVSASVSTCSHSATFLVSSSSMSASPIF